MTNGTGTPGTYFRISEILLQPRTSLQFGLLHGVAYKIMELIIADRKQYPPLNYCLYCGGTRHLTREHIVPYAMGGNWVVQKASCKDCADITKRFEARVARSMFGLHRSQFDFRTRHKKERHTHVDVKLNFRIGSTVQRVPLAIAPWLPVAAPVFDPPGLLEGRPLADSFEFDIWSWSMDQNEPQQMARLAALHKGAPVTSVSIDAKIDAVSFMRLLAKIAHGAAVVQYGVDREKSYLADYVLGTNSHYSHVIGSCKNGHLEHHLEPEPEAGRDWLAEFGIQTYANTRFFTMRIELFRYLYSGLPSEERCPAYDVVITEADDDLVARVLGPAHQTTH